MKENRLPYHNKTGFQIPEGYLESLEDRILSKVLSPELDPSEVDLSTSQKTKKPFTVPGNYFENLEDRVMKNIQGQKKKEPKLISLLTKEAFYYVAGIAAIFLAVITNVSGPQTEQNSLETLDMLSLESYLEENYDYSSPEVSNLVSEDVLSITTSAQTSYIDQEALMEYLQENIEEPSLIFNEN